MNSPTETEFEDSSVLFCLASSLSSNPEAEKDRANFDHDLEIPRSLNYRGYPIAQVCSNTRARGGTPASQFDRISLSTM